MREQVCKYMCPYARFQSVMFDPDTLIITYDYRRGEPRGGRKKNVDYKAMGLGDCVDCGICVQVCPTGIDIRNGLQYMCIGCAACIDACDQVMEKMGYPKGLIRYSTQNAIDGKYPDRDIFKHTFRPRTLFYTVLLVGIVAPSSTPWRNGCPCAWTSCATGIPCRAKRQPAASRTSTVCRSSTWMTSRTATSSPSRASTGCASPAASGWRSRR